MRTFASDVRPYPARRDDWEGCHRLTSRILADRQAQDPVSLDRGRLTEEQVKTRARIAGALVKLWGRVLDLQALPAEPDCHHDLGASLTELRAEVQTIRERTERVRAANPEHPDARADAAIGEALWWHLQPLAPQSLAHIWIAQDYARFERAQQRAQRRA
jgi:hypothetical protein